MQRRDLSSCSHPKIKKEKKKRKKKKGKTIHGREICGETSLDGDML